MQIKARVYSGITLYYGICQECGERAIICSDNTSSCCSAPIVALEEGVIKKETQIGERRKQPSKKRKLQLLSIQNNCCYWCGREFGSYVLTPTGRVSILKPCWDHYIPYVFTGSSVDTDFVASCCRCNLHKSARIIQSIESEGELREYLKGRWSHGGWEDIKTTE